MTPAKRRAGTLLASLTLATAALGGGAAAQGSGTIVVGEWQTPLDLQPWFNNAFTVSKAVSPVLQAMYEVDNNGAWIPELATELPTVENSGLVLNDDGGFTLTLTMKPGLLWSDGETLDMNDFKFTYDWAVENAIAGTGCIQCGTYVPLLPSTKLVNDDGTNVPLEEQFALPNRYVQDITVSEDGLTATVTWQEKFAGWLGWSSFTILPEHYFANIPIADSKTSMPMGPGIENIPFSGPFVITSASPQGIDYAPNPNYKVFDPPKLERLRYAYYGTKDGMIQDFLAGNVDLIDNMTQADLAAVSQVDPAIGTAEVHPAWQYEHLDFQTSRDDIGLGDPNIRQAIRQAIDLEDLWNTLFPGTPYAPACSNSPPGTWWRAEDTTCPPFDLEAADALLDAAGWPNLDQTAINSPRGRDADGDGAADVTEAGALTDPMHFTLCTTAGNPTRLTTLGKVNGYLQGIGIPTEIQTTIAATGIFASWAQSTDETPCNLAHGNFQIALYTWILGGEAGSFFYDLFHSSRIPSEANPNGGNNTRISDPELDAAVEAFVGEVDPEVLLDAAATIQQKSVDLTPEIVLYYRAEPTGVGARLKGFLQNPSSAGPLWNVETWESAS